MMAEVPEPSHIANEFPYVRRATDADVQYIHSWLQTQSDAEVPGTFMCNWNLTLKVHAEGGLAVFADPDTDLAVAYQWGGLLRPGIMEVRADLRGRGIGRALTGYRLAQARAKDEDILYIECTPSTSIPFWQSMGFQVLDSGRSGKHYAYRILARKLEMPEGRGALVKIEFFPESRKWSPSTPPISSHAPAAVQDDEGNIWLAERVHIFNGGYDRFETFRDVVACVEVNGNEVFFDKVKYETAFDLGFNECINGHYVDVLSY